MSSDDEGSPNDAPLESQVRHEVDDGVARITLDRPEVGNALSPGQRDRLITLLGEASEDLAVRAVVLAATGRAFCTGADLRASRSGPPRPEGAPERAQGEITRMLRSGAQRLVAAVLDCDKPVIAGVQGTAAGIGAHLALASDLVVAAEGARFIEVFVRRGLVPDGGGAWLLPRLVGTARAKELLLLGDDLAATDAERLGLVTRVVNPDDLEATVAELAGRLAEGPTRSMALTKHLVNRAFETDRERAFAEEAWAQELNMGTEDAAEGMASFAERRPAHYRGW